nr:MAG: hypothetical protein [Lake Baikal virophage 14]
MNALDFIKFCECNGFIGFSFKSITTKLNKDGIEKKKINGMPKWENINKENWKNFVNKSHDGFAIITGEVSGVSVLDFDTMDSYKEFLSEFGMDCIKRNCIMTNKGKHLYFKYDPDLKQTQNPTAGVDVRNDGGIIIAPPTSYTLLDGSTAKYEFFFPDLSFDLAELSPEMKDWCASNDLLNIITDEVKPKEKKKSKTKEKKSKPIEKMTAPITDDSTTISAISTEEPKQKKNGFSFLKEQKGDVADEIHYYLKNGMFNKIDKQKDPYGTWLRIGASLKSELLEEEGLALFKDISKLYPKWWDEKGCEKTYNDLKCDKITIGSLFYYLKQEDEKKFKELKKKYRTEHVDLLNSGFSTGVIADYFVSLYKNEFLYSYEVLYYWNGFYWEKDNKTHSYLSNFVDKAFTKDLTDYYLTKFKEWNEYCFENDIKLEDRKSMDGLLSEFNNSINFRLRNSHFRGSYLKDILAFLSNDTIDWDNKPTLFVFENAVIDLTTGEKVTPNPEDYLTISCGYNWEEKNANKEKVLLDLLSGIFPDELVKHHYLEILATGLCGYQQEKFFVATGKGGNGKSLLNALMIECAGKYAYTLPSEFIINSIKTGANPEVANLDGKRFALTQEPPSNRRIKCAVIKEITGNPTINARGLYSSKTEVRLRLTLVCECNGLGKYDEVGDAITRRNDITPFVSKAVSEEEYSLTSEEDRKNLIIANPFYKSNQFKQEFRIVLFHILQAYFTSFAKRNFILSAPPLAVVEKNKDQMVASDDFYNWFDATYIKSTDAEPIKIKEMFSIFKNSDFYQNLSKNDKRNFNQKHFYYKVFDNAFIKPYIIDRNRYYKDKKQDTPILIHHILKSFSTEEEDC